MIINKTLLFSSIALLVFVLVIAGPIPFVVLFILLFIGYMFDYHRDRISKNKDKKKVLTE